MSDDCQNRQGYRRRLRRRALRGCPSGAQIQLPLETDNRVLARVTDGIYRQPVSALRELIANAYDADATEVVILTDARRYSQILVRDNGNGMTAGVLVNLIQHIGGSEKRTDIGQQLGITHPNNPRLSPSGRKLIGKIGIGMCSVAQLTRQFTIITKPADENYRYTAVVTLHRYTDDYLGSVTLDSMFESGETVITSEVVEEDEAHGTTILLGNLIPGASDILQSRDRWTALLNPDSGIELGRIVPAIHTGLLERGTDMLERGPEIPWKPRTPADERMKLLARTLRHAALDNELYTQISNAFDYYFRMIWGLGLSLPLPYIDIHPYDLPAGLGVRCFRLSNRKRSAPGATSLAQATELKTGPKKTVGDAAGLPAPREGNDFRVEIDRIRLYRPIQYDMIPGSERSPANAAPLRWRVQTRSHQIRKDAARRAEPLLHRIFLLEPQDSTQRTQWITHQNQWRKWNSL